MLPTFHSPSQLFRYDENTCDIHDNNYVSEFNGGKGEYNVFVGFLGQIYVFQVIFLATLVVVVISFTSNPFSTWPLHY